MRKETQKGGVYPWLPVPRLSQSVRERDVLRRPPERSSGTLAGQCRGARIWRGLAESPQAFSGE